jgi:Rrf2 family protein
MKFSSQEEYGLRCLLRLAQEGDDGSMTIPAISQSEGISQAYVAKLMRILRRGGFVESVRGKVGGYTLARSPEKIIIGEVMTVLGGRLFNPDFCEDHSGDLDVCAHSTECSIRSLWHAVQVAVNQVLGKTTLRDLLRSEPEMASWVSDLVRLSDMPGSRRATGSH